MLDELDSVPGYLKAGFQGFQGSGKTFTATQLAIGTRGHFKLDGPIAMFDTETGSGYVAKMVKDVTGKSLVGKRSRSLDDLLALGIECEKSASVLIVDSMTHIWRDVLASYLKAVNEQRKKKNRPPRFSLEFQDWGPIKDKFAKWTDFFLNSRLHIVIAGRAGYEYDWEKNEETGKRELVKSGIRMKTEGEFGFEPSLLVEMEQFRPMVDGEASSTVIRRATVLKDRFDLIDGKVFDNPTFQSFAPHVTALKPGSHTPVDTSVKTAVDVDENGLSEWEREKRQRTILCEEIQGELTRAWPGLSAKEKACKIAAIEQAFKTRSWTKVEAQSSHDLKVGLEMVRKFAASPVEFEESLQPVGA